MKLFIFIISIVLGSMAVASESKLEGVYRLVSVLGVSDICRDHVQVKVTDDEVAVMTDSKTREVLKTWKSAGTYAAYTQQHEGAGTERIEGIFMAWWSPDEMFYENKLREVYSHNESIVHKEVPHPASGFCKYQK